MKESEEEFSINDSSSEDEQETAEFAGKKTGDFGRFSQKEDVEDFSKKDTNGLTFTKINIHRKEKSKKEKHPNEESETPKPDPTLKRESPASANFQRNWREDSLDSQRQEDIIISSPSKQNALQEQLDEESRTHYTADLEDFSSDGISYQESSSLFIEKERKSKAILIKDFEVVMEKESLTIEEIRRYFDFLRMQNLDLEARIDVLEGTNRELTARLRRAVRREKEKEKVIRAKTKKVLQLEMLTEKMNLALLKNRDEQKQNEADLKNYEEQYNGLYLENEDLQQKYESELGKSAELQSKFEKLELSYKSVFEMKEAVRQKAKEEALCSRFSFSETSSFEYLGKEYKIENIKVDDPKGLFFKETSSAAVVHCL